MMVELLAIAREYDEGKRSGWSLSRLQDKIDEWLVKVFDLHPWTAKNAFGAPLSGSEKDIFVDTRLLLEAPATPHTRLEVARGFRTTAEVFQLGDEDTEARQTCYTTIPFYAVSRSWDDGGNPTMTAVVSVEILVASPTIVWVKIDLEDGRSTEVTLRELGGVILVNPQQGEVAELVMALARFDHLTVLDHLKTKTLKHEAIDSQRCVRLFCGCNQYVNTNMAEFLKCSKSDDQNSIEREKLINTVWHYSMPHDPSLWDKEHTQICFQFQARLVTLANKGWVILQPECGWVQEYKNRIKIVEDVSMVWGWQRDVFLDKMTTAADQGQPQEIGRLPPYCVMKTTKEVVQDILEVGIIKAPKITGLFNKESKQPIFDGSSAVENLCQHLNGPRNVAPAELPTRLWNVRTNTLLDIFPSGTTYCAVSYVWQQWKKQGKENQDHRPDLDRIRSSLLEVADATNLDLFWVDGNCILQDDKDDKARELPKMGQYYGGAAFTLVLLPDVTEPQTTLSPIPWQVFDAGAHHKINRRLIEQYVHCQWLKRIWTMQEAWLARKLVFKTYGPQGGLVRGDYLELLRTTAPIIEQYGPLPVCLEWMNIGPTLVMGACTGDLIIPRETPTLLTRPAGSLLYDNNGMGLQARTTSLPRALRLCNGRGCDPRKPSGKLLGLLGMVDQGDKLTTEAIGIATARDAPMEGNPEQAFRLAVEMRMIGAEILLCGTRSAERGCSWLPKLRDTQYGVELPYTASQVLESPPTMNVTTNGAIVVALEAELTDIKLEGRRTVGSGETGYKYSCTVTTPSGWKKQARIESVSLVSRSKKRNVLLLQRPSKSGAFISVRGHPRNGDYYQRKQGFLLILADVDSRVPLEDTYGDDFRQRIIG